MKKSLLLFFLAFLAAGIHGQEGDSLRENRPDFVLSLNLFGDPSMISLGFEKLAFIKPAFSLTFNVKLGYNEEFLIFGDDPQSYFLLPHHLTALYGKNRSFLEYGIGGSVMFGEGLKANYLAYPILGYRYHPFKNPGISLRAWLHYPFGQIETINSTNVFFVPLGVSIGLAL